MENKKIDLKIEELEERIAPDVATLTAICIVQHGIATDVSVGETASDVLCARGIATEGTCQGGI